MCPFFLRYQNFTYFDHEMMVAKSPSPLPTLPAHHQAEVSCTLFTFIETRGWQMRRKARLCVITKPFPDTIGTNEVARDKSQPRSVQLDASFKKKKIPPFPILRFINLPQSNLAVLPFRTETCLHLLAVRSFPIAFSSRPAAGPHESDAVPSCSCSRNFAAPTPTLCVVVVSSTPTAPIHEQSTRIHQKSPGRVYLQCMRFQTAGCVASGDTIHDDDIQPGSSPTQPHPTPPGQWWRRGARDPLSAQSECWGVEFAAQAQTFTEGCLLDSSVLKAVLNMSGESGVPCLPKETENEDELRNICADAQNGEALDVLGEGMFVDFFTPHSFSNTPSKLSCLFLHVSGINYYMQYPLHSLILSKHVVVSSDSRCCLIA